MAEERRNASDRTAAAVSLDMLPVPALLVSLDGRALRWNGGAARVLGWRIRGETPHRLFGEDALWFRRLRDRVAVEQGPIRIVLRRRSARRSRALRATFTPMRDPRGRVDALLVCLEQLSRDRALHDELREVRRRQRRAETGLQISQERFRLLAEGVRDYAIIMLDTDGTVVSWNGGAERLTGLSADAAVNAPVAVLFPDDERTAGRPERVLAEARSNARCEEEGWCVRSDGGRFWASLTVTALRDPGRRVVGYALIVRDLTERREAEAALRRSEDHLRQAQKMEGIGRLAGGIAHDFNNLLTAIQGHAQFLLEDLPPDHVTRSDAEEIRRAADRAAALTRQLLAFSRRQVLAPQVLDLNAVIRDMNRMLRRVIREDIALVTSLADDTWTIIADAGQIEQVLMNLVVNSRDAMPEGGTVTIATRNIEIEEGWSVRGAGPQPGHWVQLTVSDNGIGMDKETQARIFEPFFTTKPEGEGTGLGLATVYGIVHQSGGHISVYSEPARGTTFRILLPRQAAAEEIAPQKETTPAPAGGHETVLIVEDDPAVRALTRRFLKGAGYTVLEAGEGDEAIRVARETDRPIDLLVTDIVMPEMSGRKLAEMLRTVHPPARVLFMSGFTEADVIQQGLIEPGAAFVEKPFSADSLQRKVREALE